MLTSEDSVANGNAENPISDAEIDEKFATFMTSAGYGDQSEAVMITVKQLDQAGSIAALIDLITAPADRT